MLKDTEELLNTVKQLEAKKTPFNQLWQEIGQYVLPNRADFTRRFGIGQHRRQQIFDMTGEFANDTFASSVLGIMANPATRWFEYRTLDESINEDEESRQWLDLAGQTVLNGINQDRAKFYGNLKSCLLDTGAFGSTGMSVMPGRKSLFAFRSYSPKKLLIMEDDEGNIDTVFIIEDYTAKQLMQMQNAKEGFEVHDHVKTKYEAKPYESIELVQAIYPNPDYNPRKLETNDNKQFRTCWVDKKHKFKMFESGFDELALPVGRWDRVTNEVWGRGPASVALSEIKMINIANRTTVIAWEKQLNPPLQVPSDGSFGQIDLSAGAINAVKDGQEIRPIQSVGDVGAHEQFLEIRRASINKAFYVDQLQLVGTQDMTATEVLQRVDERTRLMAPSIGMLQSELLGPILDRCLSLVMRSGMLPPPPKSLQGQEVRPIYVSALQRAQRSSEAQAVLAFMQNLPLFANADQSVLDRINVDAQMEEYADIVGVPAKGLRTDEEVEQIRAAKQQAQQAAAIADSLQQGAEIAKTANEAELI